MTRRIVPVLLVLALFAVPASAQTCGLLTFGFATNGAGCAPVAGLAPTLTGSLVPSPAITLCNVRFTLSPNGPVPITGFPPAILAIGVSDPMIDLSPLGLTGCVLRTSLDAVLTMSPNPAGIVSQIATIPVPMTPSLIGATAYSQALLLLPATGAIIPQISNGVRVDII